MNTRIKNICIVYILTVSVLLGTGCPKKLPVHTDQSKPTWLEIRQRRIAEQKQKERERQRRQQAQGTGSGQPYTPPPQGTGSGQPYTPPQVTRFIYVTFLKFMDTQSMTITQTQDASLITRAIIHGFKQEMQKDKSFQFDIRGHSVVSTDRLLNDLFDIMFDPGKLPDTRRNEIIQKFMEPENVDIMVFGQYIDKGDSLHVRPVVVDRRKSTIKTKSFILDKLTCVCGKNQLCPGAKSEIMRLVRQLL